MYLKTPEQTLNVSCYVKHGESTYTVYATSDSLHCFECGEIRHKRFACPQKNDRGASGDGNAASQAPENGNENDEPVMVDGNATGEVVGKGGTVLRGGGSQRDLGASEECCK